MKNTILALSLACMSGFALGQAGAGPTESDQTGESATATQNDHKLEGLIGTGLQRHGFEPNVAQKAPPANAAEMSALRAKAQSTIGDVGQQQATGVIVRFRDRSVQALAKVNEPPPDDAMAAVRTTALVPVAYHRAMAGGMYVLRFDKPLDYRVADEVVLRLRQLEIIDQVEPDLIMGHQAVSYDPWFLTYPYNMLGPAEGYFGGIEATIAWEYTTGSNSTVVAVVDTGVLPHPEFSARLLSGYDFVSDVANSNDGNGRDSDASDPGSYANAGDCGAGSEAHDSSWHGTHVAGIVAADGANGAGIAGVAWQTRILPIRVLGKCGGTMSDIVDGIHWAAGLAVPGVPQNPNPAHVINLSLGGYSPDGCTSAYQEAINEAVGQGVLVVVAAGNKSDDAARYTPANCEGVLTVMAVDPFGELASYSNFSFTGGDISAPGGDMNRYGASGGIYSTVGSGTRDRGSPTWGALHGTSMAAPHVSGIAALSLAVNPNLSGAELVFLLQFGANPFPANTYCAAYSICGSGIASALGGIAAAFVFSDYQLVYEFYNVDLNHYFRTGSKVEAGMINGGSAGPGWYDTFDYFYAWSGPVDGALPVCRFYGTPGIGPNSHFYTASAEECELVKRDPGWTYEGIAFYAKLPVAGACEAGEQPVFRAYNMRWMYNDSNHRYTTDYSEYSALIAQGWAGEGIALCGAF